MAAPGAGYPGMDPLIVAVSVVPGGGVSAAGRAAVVVVVVLRGCVAAGGAACAVSLGEDSAKAPDRCQRDH